MNMQWRVTYIFASELKYIIVDGTLWNIASDLSSRGIYVDSVISIEKVATPA